MITKLARGQSNDASFDHYKQLVVKKKIFILFVHFEKKKHTVILFNC